MAFIDIEALETAVVQRLGPALSGSGIDYGFLPDRREQFGVVAEGRVVLSWAAIVPRDGGNRSRGAQTLDLTLACRGIVPELRGDAGVYGLSRSIRGQLQGWQPQAGYPLQFAGFQMVEPPQDSRDYHFDLVFSLVVQESP